MNTKIRLGVGVIILLLLVTSFYLLNKNNSNNTNQPNSLYLNLVKDTFETKVSDLTEDDKNLSEKLTLPNKFKIEYFAKNIEGARSMAYADNGVLYVGSRRAGKVYALVDYNGDNKSDDMFEVASGLNSPNGVAYLNGDLYVAEISRIIKFKNIDETYKNDPEYEVLKDDYPKDESHGWKYIAFGPDNKLYVPVGAPCNVCENENPIYSTITRLNPDGTDFEIYATGIRNTVGFTWHPITKDLWFTDNGRDWLGNDSPSDELNTAPKKGLNFGFPFCHSGTTLDPEFGQGKNCKDYEAPIQKLGPHVAALGVKFYQPGNFPESDSDKIFIAEHGSWNREDPIGYRITTVDISEGNEGSNYQTFISGWLEENGESWGRPVDVLFLPDGSMLISDDKSGSIYRVSYLQN